MTAGTVIHLTLRGRLISVPRPDAIATDLLTRIRVVKPRLILDLGAVAVVDCSGIGLIASLYRNGRQLGGDLRLVGVGERSLRLLEVCGLLRVIRTFKNEEEALASIVRTDGPELHLERASVHICGACRCQHARSSGKAKSGELSFSGSSHIRMPKSGQVVSDICGFTLLATSRCSGRMTV